MDLRQKILFLLCLVPFAALAQPANDNCSDAVNIPSGKEYCPSNTYFDNTGATPSYNGSGRDVWFTFTPVNGYDLYITIQGAVTSTTALKSPSIKLFSSCVSSGSPASNQVSGNLVTTTNASTLYVGGVIQGHTYYISVESATAGSFSLCVQNQSAPVKPGNDCDKAKFLCSMESVREFDITGGGLDINEADGTCFQEAKETNSAWFKWEAANDGSLVFTITPIVKTDDMDWVLFDLGMTNNCAGKVALACANGSGVLCAPPGYYYKTGLDFDATDIGEMVGCGRGQDGKIKYITMQEGHFYALLVNNATSRGNGFKIDWTDQNGKAGTGKFAGPEAEIALDVKPACKYTFTSLSKNYSRLKWTFDEGASIPTSTSTGPITISYLTGGTKTVVLEAFNEGGCFVLVTKTFTVEASPIAAFRSNPEVPASLPLGYANVKFINQSKNADSYLWTFGDGATSTDINPEHEYTKVGKYAITLSCFKNHGCDASVTREILTITANSALLVPNTFTPNGDAINDEFVITGSSLRKYMIRIYTRWGKLVYQSPNIDDYWNGTYNGQPLPAGVYYYAIEGISLGNTALRKSGSVTIIR